MVSVPSLLLALILAGQQAAPSPPPPAQGPGLPDLNVMKHATLSPSYSCRSKEDFAKGFGGTALFLSDFSRERNAPDLVFNGACGGENYFEAATAGDDVGLISDLGSGVPLGSVTPAKAFNYSGTASTSGNSWFARSVPVVQGHTYAVVISKGDIRGMFTFTVLRFEPDNLVELNYAVQNYSVQRTVAQAKGFDPSRESREH